MKKLTLCLLSAGAFAAFMITWALMNPRAAEAQGGGPRVTVDGPLPLPVNADAPKTPFQATLCTFDAPVGCGAAPASLVVPANRRLVIEYVSGTCSTENLTAMLFFARLSTLVGTELATHTFVPQPVGSTSSKIYAVAQQTRIYADPGTNVTASVGSNFGSAGCFVTLSGYLL